MYSSLHQALLSDLDQPKVHELIYP